MARQNKKSTSRSRAVKASREMLIEGAASMSGNINKGLTKSVANSLISGAVGQNALDKRKMRRKIEKKLRSRKANIQVGPVMSGPEQISDLPPNKKTNIEVGRPAQVKQFLNKKSTNKMKKESTFKMKGFSGFKDESPAKAKTVTINEDGGKTVTRTRRDGTVRKVKEFKKGKKKAFKTTKTKRSGDTVTREFKKGVGGATITKRHSKDRSDYGSGSLGDKSFKQYAGKTYSETTRKQRRRNFRQGVGEFASGVAKVGLMGGGIGAGALAFPKAAKLLIGGTGVGLGATVAGSIGRGVKNTVKKIAGNIKRKRKNPNRKRL
tara:strand:- start:49 stop:1011 length:963 start_codon:yes stop_codon:yes gene_type:complete